MKTKDVLFMENRSQGIVKFLELLKKESEEIVKLKESYIAGAIVANCNPFTKGHQYLIEEALKKCDYLHLFILSDNRSMFAAEQRYDMVKAGIQGICGKERIILHRTSDYIISAATFPTYFFKEKAVAEEANCDLDLMLFSSRIAPKLGITKRFVGTEPFCKVTGTYNQRMKEILPQAGIQVIEIERKEYESKPVSASEVRRLLAVEDYESIKPLVPDNVYNHIRESING